MARTTGFTNSVEHIVGRTSRLVDGYSDKPYGKCYGQVCGVSYPDVQKAPEKKEEPVAAKSDYQRAKRKTPTNAKKVRCVESGQVYESKRDAARALGVGIDLLCGRIAKGREIGGFHYVEVV